MKIFDKDWFLKEQQKLLWFANTKFGRDILCINGNKSSIGNRKIIKIIPNGIFWLEDIKWDRENKKPISIIGFEFRTHDKFSKRLYYSGKYIWKAIHNWDMNFANKFIPALNLGFDAFPGEPLFPSMDGILGRVDAASEVFATIRAGNGAAGASTSVNPFLGALLQATSTIDQYDRLRVCVFVYNTSTLGGGTVLTAIHSIASATVSGATKFNQLGEPNFHLGKAVLASDSSLAESDYQARLFTTFGNVTYANWAADTTYNDITLNGDGLAAVNPSTNSRFYGTTNWDMLNTTVGLTWISTGISGFGMYFSEQTGTSADPKLTGTYTPAGADKWHPAPYAGYPYPREVVGY